MTFVEVLSAILQGVGVTLTVTAIGMLYAPQSGERTRRKLKKRLDEFREEAEDRATDLSRRARRKLAEIRD